MFKGATMSLDTLFGSVPTELHVLKHSTFTQKSHFLCLLCTHTVLYNVPNQNLTGRNVGIMVEHTAIVFGMHLLCTNMHREEHDHRVTKSD